MPVYQRRKGIMLAYPFSEERLLKWSRPWFVQRKLNGERCILKIDGEGTVTLLSSEEHIINSVPHIQQAFENSGLRNIRLDGELYSHGMSLQEIHSIVSRRETLHPNFEAIKYHIFDLAEENQQFERIGELVMRVQESVPKDVTEMVTTHPATDVAQIYDYINKFVDEGYEGIIVRHPYFPYIGIEGKPARRSIGMMKFKPRKTDAYVVVGYTEEKDIFGQLKGTLGALILKSDEGEEFRVGSGRYLTREARQRLWRERESLPGRIATIAYQNLTERKAPFHAVLMDLSTFIK